MKNYALPLKATPKYYGKSNGFLSFTNTFYERKEHERKVKKLKEVMSEQNTRLVNFTEIVSHNFRTHLTNFFLLVDFIEKEKDESERQNLFFLLKNAVTGFSNTIENLKEMMPSQKKSCKEKEPVNLYDAIEKVQINIKALELEHKVQCINEVNKSFYINAVPAYIESILLNFFTNSIKYRAAEREPVIKFTVRKENNYLHLFISDNCKGIDMNKFGNKLFGLHQTFHGNEDAEGIGLFITKNQVESMGGTITAESTEGQGTTFKISFPYKN